MKIFKVIRNGIITNSWTDSEGLDENYYELCFGKPERWVRDSDENVSESLEEREIEVLGGAKIIEYHLSAEFEIQIEDVGHSYEWIKVRTERNSLLSMCDWTVLSDAPLTVDQKNDWKAYRQSLRDVPDQNEDPTQIIWPTKPA